MYEYASVCLYSSLRARAVAAVHSVALIVSAGLQIALIHVPHKLIADLTQRIELCGINVNEHLARALTSF